MKVFNRTCGRIITQELEFVVSHAGVARAASTGLRRSARTACEVGLVQQRWRGGRRGEQRKAERKREMAGEGEGVKSRDAPTTKAGRYSWQIQCINTVETPRNPDPEP